MQGRMAILAPLYFRKSLHRPTDFKSNTREKCSEFIYMDLESFRVS